MVIQPDEMNSEALHSEPVIERKEVLSTFEDAYRCIKEATGVTNIQVVAVLPWIHIWCFENTTAPPLIIYHRNVSDQTNFCIRGRRKE